MQNRCIISKFTPCCRLVDAERRLIHRVIKSRNYFFDRLQLLTYHADKKNVIVIKQYDL